MIRWFWRLYTLLALLVISVAIALPFGASIQGRLFPIRGAQSIAVVERTPARLCWAWTFVKLGHTASDNLDAFMTVNGEPAGVVAPYDMDTGAYWGIARFAVQPRAEPYTLRYCIPLSPFTKPSDTVRIRQTAFYPGWLGLWRLAVPFPDVVSEGAEP